MGLDPRVFALLFAGIAVLCAGTVLSWVAPFRATLFRPWKHQEPALSLVIFSGTQLGFACWAATSTGLTMRFFPQLWSVSLRGRLTNFWHRAALWVMTTAGLSGCGGPSILDPHGPVAAANRTILLNSLAIMLVIVVPTIAGCVGFAWWFRSSNTDARLRPDFVYSGRIELLVWSIPLLVILFLGGVILIGSRLLDPFKPVTSSARPLEIEVVALDWKWLFIYPEQHIASVNRLVIPAGAPIHFKLTSASVMNSFFIPQLGSMIAVMNGMVSQLHLAADHPGNYYGQSAQFSGDGFAGMNFMTSAVAQTDFDGWVSKVNNAGRRLDAAAYKELAQQSQNVTPFTYGAVEDDLFDQIVNQRQPTGPGPEVVSGGRAFSSLEKK